ncbi:G patch domain and ankyrin repeat-containing protein 1 [Tachyglossus aculeatus]|uniref:G patch domain and ankyrin repeat-containing protein 1 n=1 Tax=Tachyglossus aculeatus TaxID=9261 RepID=UPI0018F35810|nr:G patch domain and ankyrin repeat-containing protein 1 [Tachyglossus aculeatus]XP_038624683.1 G patch domain and ankyrin repeat-containing protein 1 [Tachyglossus aculeatus]
MAHPALIAFTPAQDPGDLWKDGEQRPQQPPEQSRGSPLDGEAVRSFYEDLVGAGSPRRTPVGRTDERKERRRGGGRDRGGPGTRPPVGRTIPRLLKAAQDGDVEALRGLLGPGGDGDVNAHDAFWWTPLMCAARAGRADAVRFLLSRGAAWVGVCEPGGRDAAQLAEEAGFPEVARLVRDSGRPRPPETRSPSPEPRYCDVCQTCYRDANHASSTAHLLALPRGPRTPHPPPGFPASSPGFRLLLRGGWEPGTGLGPHGQGRAEPVATVLKRDLEGLGYGQPPRPRVTHFPAGDPRAVRGPARAPKAATLGKRKEKQREEKSRAWERNLRTYMNLDF